MDKYIIDNWVSCTGSLSVKQCCIFKFYKFYIPSYTKFAFLYSVFLFCSKVDKPWVTFQYLNRNRNGIGFESVSESSVSAPVSPGEMEGLLKRQQEYEKQQTQADNDRSPHYCPELQFKGEVDQGRYEEGEIEDEGRVVTLSFDMNEEISPKTEYIPIFRLK